MRLILIFLFNNPQKSYQRISQNVKLLLYKWTELWAKKSLGSSRREQNKKNTQHINPQLWISVQMVNVGLLNRVCYFHRTYAPARDWTGTSTRIWARASAHAEPQVQHKVKAKTFSSYLAPSTPQSQGPALSMYHPPPTVHLGKSQPNDDQYSSNTVHNKAIYQEKKA